MLVQLILYTTDDNKKEKHYHLKQNHNKITATCKDDVWTMQDIHDDNLLFAWSASYKNLMSPDGGSDIMYLPTKEMLEIYYFSLWRHRNVLLMLHDNKCILDKLIDEIKHIKSNYLKYGNYDFSKCEYVNTRDIINMLITMDDRDFWIYESMYIENTEIPNTSEFLNTKFKDIDF